MLLLHLSLVNVALMSAALILDKAALQQLQVPPDNDIPDRQRKNSVKRAKRSANLLP